MLNEVGKREVEHSPSQLYIRLVLPIRRGLFFAVVSIPEFLCGAAHKVVNTGMAILRGMRGGL